MKVCILSPVSCILSPVSCLLSPVSCLLTLLPALKITNLNPGIIMPQNILVFFPF